MIQNSLGKLARQTKSASDYIRWQILGSQNQSVYFYTLHKCASSLFAGYILPNALGLRHVHLARQIHRHLKNVKLDFEQNGHIYGPIRVSANRQSAVYDNFVQHVIQPEFVQDKQAIFFIRDPRDILVSAYYSFGYHHKLSPDKGMRQKQLACRSRLQSMDIDDYAIKNFHFFRKNFQLISDLHRNCQFSLVLKFEQMINDFDRFARELNRMVRLRPSIIRHAYKVSRPRSNEKNCHRRSGQTGDFRRKLRADTIDRLNYQLADILDEFEYEK